MTTLNLPRLSMGLPVWLFFTLVVLNTLDAYQVSIVCQDNQINVKPFLSLSRKYSPRSSSLFGEGVSTSLQDSKKKKRKGRKKKPTQGRMQLATISQAEGNKPTTMSHARGKSPATTSETECTCTIEKYKKVGCKPNFPRKLCKGYHLTHLFLGIIIGAKSVVPISSIFYSKLTYVFLASFLTNHFMSSWKEIIDQSK
jgi:hypothetical protein